METDMSEHSAEKDAPRVTGVELHCDDCQQPYAVWFTDNEVWNFVMSEGATTKPEWGGMLCPRCFTIRAERVYSLPIWRVRLDRVNRVARPEEDDDQGVFIGSVALLDALYETYREHIGTTESEGPSGPYLWCACGWRSDDLDGHGTRSDSPGQSYAIHLTNAQHAAAVKALQPIVRRVLSPAE